MANQITTLFSFQEKGRGLKQIKADVRGVDGAWNKLRTGFKSSITEFKNSTGAQAAAAAAIGAAAKYAIEQASRLNESINAVNVTYGANAEAVHKIGEASADSFGLARADFNQMAVSFAAFAETVTPAGGQVADTVEDMVGRVADFASVMNLEVAEAGEVFQSIMAGSTEVARRYGMDVSAAKIEQYLLAEGFVTTKSAITETMKVQARYTLLMEQTSKMAGDFKNTQDGLANSQRTLSARATDAAAEMGQTLLPLMEDLAAAANEVVLAFDAVKDGLDSLPGGGVIKDGLTMMARGWGYLTQKKLEDAQADRIKLKEEQRLHGIGMKLMADRYNAHNRDSVRAAKAAAVESEAMRDAARAANFMATQVAETARANELASEAAEAHADKVDELYEATARMIGGDIGVRAAQRAAAEAMDKLSSSAAAQSEEVDRATEAQLRAAEAVVSYRVEQLEASGQTVTVVERTKMQREALQTLADELDGPVRDALLAYIAQLDGIPRQIDTWVNANYRDVYHSEMSRDDARARNAGSVNNYPARASGGPVSAGRTYLVGEQGPELITPSAGGTVIPNDQLRGGASPAVNITVNAGVGTDGVQVGRQVAEALERYYRSGGRRI